ncbi:MAG TPA: DUF4810 domain-containing protein [Opitutaceae bacterium]|nr:DUF4810 domain-containing protein [Opitutaceae bacterium]
MNHRHVALLPLIAAVVLLAGCQTARPLYYWGNYEGTLYSGYSKPGSISPDEGIARMQEDLAKAAATGRAPNPGLHAQLGFYYLQAGNGEAARAEFEAEKALYPESATLMDRMISKLQAAPTS